MRRLRAFLVYAEFGIEIWASTISALGCVASFAAWLLAFHVGRSYSLTAKAPHGGDLGSKVPAQSTYAPFRGFVGALRK